MRLKLFVKGIKQYFIHSYFDYNRNLFGKSLLIDEQIEKNLKQIEFRINTSYFDRISLGGTMLIIMGTETYQTFVLNTETEPTFYYSVNIIEKINTLRSEFKCIEAYNGNNNSLMITKIYFKTCAHECQLNYLNKIYGCVPFDNKLYVDLIIMQQLNYRYCNINVKMSLTIFNRTEYICIRKCEPQCIIRKFDLKIVSKNVKQFRPLIVVKFIPDLQYVRIDTETLKMSVIELLSNFGGITGLWFGLSFIHLISFMAKIISLLLIKTLTSQQQ
jgi:hypothetical protein